MTLDYWMPSLEGRRVAYGLSRGGDEESTLHVIDVDTGRDLGEHIDRTRYSSIAWLPGGDAFYYVRRLPPHRVPVGEHLYYRRVYLHCLGADPEDDVMVFGEGRDPRTYYFVLVSADGRWLTLHARVGTDEATDVYLADLAEDGGFHPIIEGSDARTYAQVRHGRLYVHTNLDAPRFRIVVADPHRPEPSQWRDLVPESDAVLIDLAPAGGALAVHSMRHVRSRVHIHDAETGALVDDLALPEVCTVETLSSDPATAGAEDICIGFVSFTTPPRVLRYHVPSRQVEVWAESPGRVLENRFEARQLFCRSKDGTQIPMFVIKAKATPLDGTAPGVLSGYGGFNISQSPAFLGTWIYWLERGGVFALANLRGGGEYGEAWHRAGMRGAKQNVFDDFLAAADHLVSERIVAPDRLAAAGGSNGGLLVGAALTQRPARFAAVVCGAPLLDMVRYEQFGLGRSWNGEYGSADDPKALRWLFAHSPYHHVQDSVAYPPVLFKTYESDSRVDPLHARKMAARLQAATTAAVTQRPIILRRETKAGHAGKAISRVIEDAVDTQIFLLHYLRAMQ